MTDTATNLFTKPPGQRTRTARTAGSKRLAPLQTVETAAWAALAASAVEPNGYYLPEWERAVNALAEGRGDALAIAGRSASTGRLIALLPAVPAWSAFRMPLPALVSADPYGVLGTPLLDGNDPLAAARALIGTARGAGASCLVLRDVPLEGRAVAALRTVLAEDELAPRIVHSYARAALDATQDGDTALRAALGPRKLKELRRQANRLADHGALRFTVARSPDEVAAAVEVFLALEASGWKGERGTAIAMREGDAAFLRRASVALAEHGGCEIATLSAGDTPVAAGIVLRHQDRAFWFKLGFDERFARHSPGVQLTMHLTRHLCADPQIALADSTAAPGHPMIESIWRDRLTLGDVVLPLERGGLALPLTSAALKLRQRFWEYARATRQRWR